MSGMAETVTCRWTGIGLSELLRAAEPDVIMMEVPSPGTYRHPHKGLEYCETPLFPARTQKWCAALSPCREAIWYWFADCSPSDRSTK